MAAGGQRQRLPIRTKCINFKKQTRMHLGLNLRMAKFLPKIGTYWSQTNMKKGSSDNRDRKQSESSI